MAAEGEADRAARSHRNSYQLFIAMMKWGTIISFVTVMFVILIIQ